MTNIAIATLSALLATNRPTGVTNLVLASPGAALAPSSTNDPVQQALDQLMQADNDARAEVEKWVTDNEKFTAQGAGVPGDEMRRRILARLAPVRKGYEDLIQLHTNNTEIRIAFASYLGDVGEEDAAIAQLETARGIEPKDPVIWNNLANLYGHSGELAKAFDFYTKAIELKPDESLYYHNLGTAVFLFRTDAKEHYQINEQQVFDKALNLYSNAIRCDPQDFQLAADVAQTFYGIQPPRTDDALRAWTNAFQLARDDEEREGVQTHFARVKIKAGLLAEAQTHLNAVTNEMYADAKRRLTRVLKEAEEKLSHPDSPSTLQTNAASAK